MNPIIKFIASFFKWFRPQVVTQPVATPASEPQVEDKPLDIKVEAQIETPAKTIEVTVDTQEKPIVQIEVTPNFRIKNVVNSLLKHGSKKYNKRSLDQIEQIVIHCSDTDPGNGSTPYAFAKYHVNYLGWPGIGYHFVIDEKGTIYQTNFLSTVSNHVDNANTKSVGICLVGRLDEVVPPKVQIDALKWLVNSLQESISQGFHVYGHNRFTTKHKTCPGKNMYSIVDELTKQYKPVA